MNFETTLAKISAVPTSTGRREFPTTICQRRTAAYSQVTCQEGAKAYGVDIEITPLGKASVFVVANGRPQNVPYHNQVRYPLQVPITWNDTGRDIIPFTRDKENNRDNIDVIVMKPDGEFVNIEVGLVTRFGDFFLTAQRVYQGQMVRTRRDGVLVTTAIPTASIHAYPDATFEGIWSTVADACVANAKEMGASEQKSRVMRYHAEWKPPALTQSVEQGWMAGITTYFNLLSGTGNVKAVNGGDYFVHFKNIRNDDGDRDAFPILTPMAVVQFQPDKASAHDRPAAARVRPIKPIPIGEPAHTK